MHKRTRSSVANNHHRHHAFDITQRITIMTVRIRELEARLESTISHLERIYGTAELNEHVIHVKDGHPKDEPREVESVTTCFLQDCSGRSTKTGLLDGLREDPDQIINSEGNSKLPQTSLYKQPLPEGLKWTAGVPNSREAWLEFLVWLVKQRILFKYLNDTKLKRVIQIARGQIGRLPQYEKDPEIPICYYWDEDQVATWIEEIGFPHLQDAFRQNSINGRRLLGVDASALTKMGIHNWKEIKEVAGKIRSIFGLTKPNGMRAIFRKPPYETFLKEYRIHNGRTYDLLTFKQFCKKYNYKYQNLIETRNKNAIVPCNCTILIRTTAEEDIEDDDSIPSDDSLDNESLLEAPSVEFHVRHQFIRNQAIEKIVNELIEVAFSSTSDVDRSKHAIAYVDELIEKILNDALLELGFSDPKLYTRQRVKFAAQIALALLTEMRRTADVLSDINQLKTHIKLDVSPEEIATMKEVTGSFMEDLASIAAMLALNQLSLEAIFKHQPSFQQFADEIVKSAQHSTNVLIPEARAFVDSVLSEAKLRVIAATDFPYLSLPLVKSAVDVAKVIIDDLLNNTFKLAEDASQIPPKAEAKEYEHYVFPVSIEGDTTEGQMQLTLKDLCEKVFEEKQEEEEKKEVGLNVISHGGDTNMTTEIVTSNQPITNQGFPEMTIPPIQWTRKPINRINLILKDIEDQKLIGIGPSVSTLRIRKSNSMKVLFKRMKPNHTMTTNSSASTFESIPSENDTLVTESIGNIVAEEDIVLPLGIRNDVQQISNRPQTAPGLKSCVKKISPMSSPLNSARPKSASTNTNAKAIWKEIKVLRNERVTPAFGNISDSKPMTSNRPQKLKRVPSFKKIVDQWIQTQSEINVPSQERKGLSHGPIQRKLITNTSLQILGGIFKDSLQHTMSLKPTSSSTGPNEMEMDSSIGTTDLTHMPMLEQNIRNKVIGSLRKALENGGYPVNIGGNNSQLVEEIQKDST